MSIYRGTREVAKLYRGEREVKKVYRGTNVLYESMMQSSGYVCRDGILISPSRRPAYSCLTCSGDGRVVVVEDGIVTGQTTCPDCGGTGVYYGYPAEISGAGVLTYTLDEEALALYIYAGADETEAE